MKDDKKKLIVVVALALVIVCVGVFQFVAGGSPAPAPAATAKKEEKKAEEVKPGVEPPKNPRLATSLAVRDPFEQPASVKALDKPKPVEQPKPMEPALPEAMRLPQGDIEKSGSFGGGGTAPVIVQSIPEPKFAFTLSGIMLGAKPMAVFTDAQGNQRLILLGGSLDPESKVISIERDTVTVRFHGKTLRLTVEGNPNAK